MVLDDDREGNSGYRSRFDIRFSHRRSVSNSTINSFYCYRRKYVGIVVYLWILELGVREACKHGDSIKAVP